MGHSVRIIHIKEQNLFCPYINYSSKQYHHIHMHIR